jgi:hypothetical protein
VRVEGEESCLCLWRKGGEAAAGRVSGPANMQLGQARPGQAHTLRQAARRGREQHLPCAEAGRTLLPTHTRTPAHASHSVINGIQTSDIRNLFNPENIFISKEGGGALVLVCVVRVCVCVAPCGRAHATRPSTHPATHPDTIRPRTTRTHAGAGNNWASGFSQGSEVQETLMDMIGECGVTVIV